MELRVVVYGLEDTMKTLPYFLRKFLGSLSNLELFYKLLFFLFLGFKFAPLNSRSSQYFYVIKYLLFDDAIVSTYQLE